jgi:hypothetical protein
MSSPNIFEKALRRLVEAITHPETDMNRIEMMEGALAYAGIALGDDGDDEDMDLIRENLEQLAAQTLIDKLDREGLTVSRLSVRNGREDELGSIIATTNPMLGTLIAEQIRSLIDSRKEPDNFDVC